MHKAEFGSAVSPIMTMPYFALILEITTLNSLDVCKNVITIITSRISGRGNVLGLVCVCLCVCLYVLNRWTYGPKIQHTHQGPTYLGQVSRSKVKVTKVKNVKKSSFQPSIREGGPRSRLQRSRS